MRESRGTEAALQRLAGEGRDLTGQVTPLHSLVERVGPGKGGRDGGGTEPFILLSFRSKRGG